MALRPRASALRIPTPWRAKAFIGLLIVFDVIVLVRATLISLDYPVLFFGALGLIAVVVTIARTAARRPRKRIPRNADEGSLFQLQERIYRVGRHGVRAIQLIFDMADAIDREPNNPGLLLRYRRRVREVMQSPPRAVLACLATRTDDAAQRRLAVWLRGRCRGILGTRALAELWPHADVPLRKELTRAFQRMDAWDYLRRIEENDPEPRIRQLARQSASRPFDSRLARFMARVARSEAPGRETPLFLHEEFDLAVGRPAKPPWLIRRILEHIRSLIRGSPENRALQSD